MADVFISYRNTPERRALVRRLAAILRAHEVTVWWDYGLEAGESYRAQITTELAKARVVAPLWCAESVNSKWVRMEAELGKDKLVPARLQRVTPPDAFEAIHAADLIGWDGAVRDTRVLEFARRICERLGHVAIAPTDMIEELAHLPAVPPLPEIAPVTVGPASVAGPTHDYSFWERQWEKFGTSDNLIALRDVADEAPRIFANQARARIAEIEAMQQRQAEERERQRVEEERLAAFRAEGRIKVDVEIFHGDNEAVQDGWFKPGAGKTEWFKDLDTGPDMIVVPAGEFLMGSPEGEGDDEERPQHKVKIAKPFAVGVGPVTRGEFSAFIREADHEIEIGAYVRDGKEWREDPNRSWRDPGFEQDDDHPVVCVNWHDARAYASWLRERSGKSYRLLSEAEREYCCRASTSSRYNVGNDITSDQANFGRKHQGTTSRLRVFTEWFWSA